jgi:phage tail-like protein
MENKDGSKQDNVWPIPKFYFKVKFSTLKDSVSFQEVSGLDIESQILEYRGTNNPVFSTIKMPGIKKYSSITLKKGIFSKENDFFNWFSEIKMNTIKKNTITIELLDKENNPTMVWTLNNATITKITGTDLKSDGNEVAIESLEITHEGLTIANS